MPAAVTTFKNAFSQIDVQLTRRYDLIPNLVEPPRQVPVFDHALEELSQPRVAETPAT